MVINHYSQKSLEEQIHTYLRVLDYIYESSKYEEEDSTDEKENSNIRETVSRQER